MLRAEIDPAFRNRLSHYEAKFSRGLRKARKPFAIITVALVVAQFLSPFISVQASGPRDFDDNAVVFGGAYSKGELTTKINNGDGKNGDLKTIFNTIGISNSAIEGAQTLDGVVTKSGQVIVGSSVVASDVFSAGRHNLAGSVPDASLPIFWRHPSVSFVSSQIPAFVHLNVSGQFVWAIIKSCGNPVALTPSPRFAPSLAIDKTVKNKTDNEVDFKKRENASPGDELFYRLKIDNPGASTALNVRVKDSLPPKNNYIKGSTRGYFGGVPGRALPDGITGTGVNIGSIEPGAWVVVTFRVTLDQSFLRTDPQTLVNTGCAQGSNTARVCSKATVVLNPGAIRIIKFEDKNGNGVRDAGEPKRQGFRFRLVETGDTGVTDKDGWLVFRHLPAGIYHIREINIPSGWRITTPNPQQVTVISGTMVRAFVGNQRIVITQQPAEIEVIKFNDLNANGTEDQGEGVLAGFTFRLEPTGATATTDSQGRVLFQNLEPGNYTVREVDIPAGWRVTTPNPQDVSVAANSTSTVRFGNVQETPPPPQPPVEQPPVEVLPRVGAASNIAFAFGLFLLFATGYLWARERIRFEMAFLR